MPTGDRTFLRALGQRVAERRKAQGLTQADLATRLGISQQLVASYKGGRRRLPVALLPALAQHLAVSVEALLGLTNGTSKRGPTPKFQRHLEQLSRLPRPASASSSTCSRPSFSRPAADPTISRGPQQPLKRDRGPPATTDTQGLARVAEPTAFGESGLDGRQRLGGQDSTGDQWENRGGKIERHFICRARRRRRGRSREVDASCSLHRELEPPEHR
jgi:transcriptional regulator with XRE-family HTH domain